MLNLRANEISEIPDFVFSLPHLEQLDLRWNDKIWRPRTTSEADSTIFYVQWYKDMHIFVHWYKEREGNDIAPVLASSDGLELLAQGTSAGSVTYI